MKNYVKYISLGTATILLNSYNVNADVHSELLEANKAFAALKSNPENWKTVAESFIKIFDTFNNKLIEIAEENGGKAEYGSFIEPMGWKEGRVTRFACDVHHYLTPNKQNEISKKYKYSWDQRDAKAKYFKHYVQKPLMAEICKEVNGVDVKKVADLKKKIEKKEKILTTKDLNSLKSKHFKQDLETAGNFWINNFVKPVGQLLIVHSKEMNKDIETLMCLLNLWRVYRSCETCITKVPDAWEKNFKEAYDAFGTSLASTIVNCKEEEEEKKEICCKLLNKDPLCPINAPNAGCETIYNFTTQDLVSFIGSKNPVCEDIKVSLNDAKDIVKYWNDVIKAQQEGYQAGVGAQIGFGL